MQSATATTSVLQTENDFFHDSILVKPVEIRMRDFSTYEDENGLNDFIISILEDRYEGKCIEEGYVEKGSISKKKEQLQLSAGQTKGATILFYVKFGCRICTLAEDMVIACQITEIMTVGLQGVALFSPSPFRVMVYNLELSTDNWKHLTTQSTINIRILNVSSEINHPEIQVIGDIEP